MPGIVGWFYYWRGHRSGWKIAFFIAGAIAVCAQLPLQWTSSYSLALILQGPVLGIALGTLFTLSTLVLSSHYRYNLPLVSMQSGFMGFLGAVVYTSVARQLLTPYNHYAPAATAGVMAATLLVAILLLHRIKDNAIPPQTQLKLHLPKNPRTILQEKGTLFFILGYILTFSSIFTFPIFMILIITQPPALIQPDLAALALITCLSTAAISASISANPIVRRHIGPVNTFITSCMLAGAASILPIFMPYFSLALVAAGVYGISLGAIIALHIKATTVFHAEMLVWHPDMPARTAIMMALGGLSAFVGLLVSAAVMENMEDGVKVAFGLASGCLVCGGGLIGVGRWRRCSGVAVAI
ncbi:major facilitator superfamily domain-containing protein [Paraphoma chrysanthemicola]|uniref:Major facilitator superfamily domain-containing protein n=1 Tax=Paraphoma chrysanthemicola TaxID=798071 RepID=A0A8K0W3J9_9PLEO|nr:major facilitator superfamily domain-containing protein [Paraphoma chrysanthemicola]